MSPRPREAPTQPRQHLGVFISYRRDDSSGYAGRLYDDLVERFGEESIFIDVDTLQPGLDFTEVVARLAATCDVFIAVIGRSWLTASDAAGKRRLDNPDDYVRLEIQAALETERSRVIPVLVQAAAMPDRNELPEPIRKLANRHAIELSDARWHFDVDRLSQTIELIAEQRALEPPKGGGAPVAPATGIGSATRERSELPQTTAKAETRNRSRRLRALLLVSVLLLATVGTVVGIVATRSGGGGGEPSPPAIHINHSSGAWDSIYIGSNWHAFIAWDTTGDVKSCTLTDNQGTQPKEVAETSGNSGRTLYPYGPYGHDITSTQLHLHCEGSSPTLFADEYASVTQPRGPLAKIMILRLAPEWLDRQHTRWQALISWHSKNALDCKIFNNRDPVPRHRDASGETRDPYGDFPASASSVLLTISCRNITDIVTKKTARIRRPANTT